MSSAEERRGAGLAKGAGALSLSELLLKLKSNVVTDITEAGGWRAERILGVMKQGCFKELKVGLGTGARNLNFALQVVSILVRELALILGNAV